MNNLLHVFGQPMWHSEVAIIGDTEALLALKAAIEAALTNGRGGAMAFTGDGEGFHVLVAKQDDPELYGRIAVPYSDETAGEKRADAIWPMDVPGIKEADRELRERYK